MFGRGGWPHPGLDGQTVRHIDRAGYGDAHVRARGDDLPLARIGAIGGRGHSQVAVARAGRIAVSVDQSDQAGGEAGGFATDHEADGLARLNAEAVGVAKQDRCRRGHGTDHRTRHVPRGITCETT